MPVVSGGMRGAAVTIIVVAGMIGGLSISAFLLDEGSGSAPGFAPYNIGDGLLSAAKEQNVSGTAYWDAFCAAPKGQQFPYCVSPVGIVLVPSANIMVLTEANDPVYGNGTGPSGIVEIDPATNQNISELYLPCEPGIPFYPGSGVDVFVPCTNFDFDNYSLLEFDYLTNQVVASVSTPIWIDSMTYDSENGFIYGGGLSIAWGTDLLVAFNPASLTIVSATKLPLVDFVQGWPRNGHTVLYDSFANRLLVPSNASELYNSSLLAYSPTTNTTTSVESTLTGVVTLTIDPQTDQVFVAMDPGSSGAIESMLILNGTTYSIEDRVVLPNCIMGLCSNPPEVSQILIDSRHGDAYLLSSVGLFTLNLSTLSVVGEIAMGGAPAASAYDPPTDRIIGTYDDFGQVLPGFLIQLDHTTYGEVTSFFWLPVPLGTVAIAVTLALVVGGVAFWRTRRLLAHGPRTRPD